MRVLQGIGLRIMQRNSGMRKDIFDLGVSRAQIQMIHRLKGVYKWKDRDVEGAEEARGNEAD